VLEDAEGNIVFANGKHLVALLGVDDLIVIQTEDATLVCRKDRAQDIKKVVTQISQNPEWKNLL
jgi:mannose-1-phosphate guanylyltransferase